MARQQRPVFLERKSYRRRRLMDALRLVVLLGIVLWMMPLLWPTGSDAGAEPLSMSRALFYVFGVWVLLIALAAGLAGVLRARPDTPDDSA